MYCSCHSNVERTSIVVYNHFTESGDNVSCNYFDKTHKKTTTTSSTNPLWYHLKAAHSIVPTERTHPCSKETEGAAGSSQQGLITIFVEKKSQQEMYSQLAGAGRLSFNQIARSQFMRSAMRDKKLIAHSSTTTILSKGAFTYDVSKILANFIPPPSPLSATVSIKRPHLMTSAFARPPPPPISK